MMTTQASETTLDDVTRHLGMVTDGSTVDYLTDVHTTGQGAATLSSLFGISTPSTSSISISTHDFPTEPLTSPVDSTSHSDMHSNTSLDLGTTPGVNLKPTGLPYVGTSAYIDTMIQNGTPDILINNDTTTTTTTTALLNFSFDEAEQDFTMATEPPTTGFSDFITSAVSTLIETTSRAIFIANNSSSSQTNLTIEEGEGGGFNTTMTTISPLMTMTGLPVDSQQFLQEQNARHVISLTPTLVYLGLVLVGGSLGNALVLLVHWRRFRPSVTRCYVLAVSVCGLLTTGLALPAELLEVGYWALYTAGWACRLSRGVKSFFSFLAACILVAVALERHRKICGPYFRCCAVPGRWGSAGRHLAGCVVFSLLITLPYMILSGPQTVRFQAAPNVNVTGSSCSILDDYVNSWAYFIYSLAAGLTFISCFVIIAVSYFRIGRLIWRHQRRRRFSASRRSRNLEHVTEAQRQQELPSIHIHTDEGNDVVVKQDNASDIKTGDDEHNARSVEGRTTNNITATSKDLKPSLGSGGRKTEPSCPAKCQKNLLEVCRDQDSVSSDYSSLQPLHLSSTATTSIHRDTNEPSLLMKKLNDEAATPEVNHNAQQPSSDVESGLKAPRQGKEPGSSSSTSLSNLERFKSDLARLVTLRGLHGLKQDHGEGKGGAKDERGAVKSSDSHNGGVGGAVRTVTALSRATAARSKPSARKIPTRTTLTMFVLTVVCVFVNYFPYMLIVSLNLEPSPSAGGLERNVYNVAMRSYFVYTVLNPLVVGLCSSRFRRECQHFFARK